MNNSYKEIRTGPTRSLDAQINVVYSLYDPFQYFLFMLSILQEIGFFLKLFICFNHRSSLELNFSTAKI